MLLFIHPEFHFGVSSTAEYTPRRPVFDTHAVRILKLSHLASAKPRRVKKFHCEIWAEDVQAVSDGDGVRELGGESE